MWNILLHPGEEKARGAAAVWQPACQYSRAGRTGDTTAHSREQDKSISVRAEITSELSGSRPVFWETAQPSAISHYQSYISSVLRRDRRQEPGHQLGVREKYCGAECLSGKKTLTGVWWKRWLTRARGKIYRCICIYHVQFCYVYHHRGWGELRCPAGVKNVILANLFLFLFLFFLTN